MESKILLQIGRIALPAETPVGQNLAAGRLSP